MEAKEVNYPPEIGCNHSEGNLNPEHGPFVLFSMLSSFSNVLNEPTQKQIIVSTCVGSKPLPLRRAT